MLLLYILPRETVTRLSQLRRKTTLVSRQSETMIRASEADAHPLGELRALREDLACILSCAVLLRTPSCFLLLLFCFAVRSFLLTVGRE